jgi:hypothetical protein
MKRMVLITLLLLGGGIAAQADTSTYTSKIPRSDADLQAAGDYCDQMLGPVHNGEITPTKYKRCMLSQGWRYQSTAREHTSSEQTSSGHTWIDPDTGGTCHDILSGAGSSCGNF